MSDLINTLKSTIGLRATVAELIVALIQGSDYRTSYDKANALKALTGPEAAFLESCNRLIKAMEAGNGFEYEIKAAKDALKHLIDTMKVLQAQHAEIVNALDGAATGLSTEAADGLKAAYAAAGAKAASIFDVEKAKVEARLNNAEDSSSSSVSAAEKEKQLLGASVDGLAAIYAKLLNGGN